MEIGNGGVVMSNMKQIELSASECYFLYLIFSELKEQNYFASTRYVDSILSKIGNIPVPNVDVDFTKEL